jgi:hypothetical protein
VFLKFFFSLSYKILSFEINLILLFKRFKMSDNLNIEEKNEEETKRINISETKLNISDKSRDFYDISNDQILEDSEIIDNSIISDKIISSQRIVNVEKDNILEEPEITNRQIEKNIEFQNNILNTKFNDNTFFIHCRNCMKIISIEESKYKF